MADTKIKSSNISGLAVTHDKLHTDMNLTSKTVQVATPTADAHPATKSYVDTEVANLIDSAPGTLDTLNELAAAIGDDANFAATVTTGLSNKLPLAGGTMTGVIAGFESTGIDDNAANTSVTILSDGKVGIGIESPVRTLDVDSSTSSDIARFGNDSGAYTLGYTTDLASIDLASSAGLRVRSGSTLALQTTSAGHVGIGTPSPNSKLDVRGGLGANGTAATPTAYFVNNQSGATSGSIYIGASTGIDWQIGKNVTGILNNINFSIADSSNNRRLDIDSSGNVGIGTTSPDGRLTISGGQYVNNIDGPNDLVIESSNSTGGGIRLTNHTNKNWFMYHGGSGSWVGDGGLGFVYSDGTTSASGPAVTFKPNGNVGIGTSSPDYLLDVGNGTSAPAGGKVMRLNSNGDTIYSHSRASTSLMSFRNDGAGYVAIASNNSAKLMLGYSTNDAGAIANHLYFQATETIFNGAGEDRDFRVESDSNQNMLFVDGGDGYVSIGSTSAGSSWRSTDGVRFAGYGHNNYGYSEFVRTSDNDASANIYIARNNDGRMLSFNTQSGEVGTVTITTSGTTYNTTSDRRLKDNIQPITDATYKLMDMKPVTHTWIDNPDEPQVHGFIAQEMQEVVPEAVSGDAESDEMMSMDYGRITPVIVAALQDALKAIEELKERINELEAK